MQHKKIKNFFDFFKTLCRLTAQSKVVEEQNVPQPLCIGFAYAKISIIISMP